MNRHWKISSVSFFVLICIIVYTVFAPKVSIPSECRMESCVIIDGVQCHREIVDASVVVRLSLMILMVLSAVSTIGFMVWGVTLDIQEYLGRK